MDGAWVGERGCNFCLPVYVFLNANDGTVGSVSKEATSGTALPVSSHVNGSMFLYPSSPPYDILYVPPLRSPPFNQLLYGYHTILLEKLLS